MRFERIGRYDVTALLGEGGMGQVWQATDTQLNRQVALKILPESFASDPDRLARFTREAQILASLNHPNIAAIYGIEEAEGTRALVLELVDGPTLADRISKEPIPLDEALPIAKQIAEALEAAHEAGVIHRDLKPANIKVREDGTVKVLDFGLAKALDPSPTGDPSESPTLTAAATQMGVIMGTAAYMSPEQARGKLVDRRADVFAFGVVLYEMLTGQRPFQGDDASLTLAAVMTFEPDLELLPETLSPTLKTYLARCLSKDPKERVRDIGDVRLAMAGGFDVTGDEHFGYGEAVADIAGASASPWKRLTVGFAITTVLLALAAAWGWLRPSSTPPPNTAATTLRFPLSEFRLAAGGGSGRRVAISPDGSRIVLVSVRDGKSRLFMRLANEVGFTEIPGTEDASGPVFSPDGEWLAFNVGLAVGVLEIKRVESSGGPILPVAQGALPHWGVDDVLVFTRGSGIYQMAVSGGEPTLVYESEDINEGQVRPHLLPDGRAILFQGPGNVVTRRLMMVDVGSGAVTDLGIVGNDPRYVPTGHIVYGHSSQSLMAVPFDLETHQVTGAPSNVLPEVLVFYGGATQFAVSETGTAVVGLPAVGAQDRELVMVAFDGSESPLPFRGNFNHPRFAPDGERIAYESGRQIEVYDQVTGALDFLTSGSNYQSPSWSRDGRYVYYSGWVGGSSSYDGVRRLADRSEEEELLYHHRDGNDFPLALSLDGNLLLVEVNTPGRGRDMVLVTQGADSAVFSDYLRANWNETSGALSPDGRWLAYVSDESGIPEVYVRTFPVADAQRIISSGGGTQPLWAPDGSAIYFRDGNRVVRAAVTVGETLSVDSLDVLFQAEWIADALGRHDWDIHPDGHSFVAVKGPATEETEVDGVPIIPVQMVVNFFQELRQRMGN